MPQKTYALEMAKRLRQGTLAQVGRHLRMLRTAMGQSQQEWAYALLITPQMLNKWEKGTRQPNIDVLIRICDSYGCTLDFIFRGRLGRDVAPELREKLSSFYGEDAFVLLGSPVERPPPQDQSDAAASPTRAPRKKKRQSNVRASARQKPPAAPGGSSKSS